MPLHDQIVDSGFLQFLGSAPEGPLFYPLKPGKSARVGATTVAGRVTEWLQSLKVIPEGVSPRSWLAPSIQNRRARAWNIRPSA